MVGIYFDIDGTVELDGLDGMVLNF